MWRKENPFALLVGMQTSAALWKAVWTFLKILKMDLPFDLVIHLLGICPKESKTLIWKNISTPLLIAALFTITKIWKQPKHLPMDEWINQLWDNYTMKFYLGIKRRKNYSLQRWSWRTLLSEISQSGKDKCHMISLMWNLMNWTNKQNRDRLIDGEQMKDSGEEV